MLNKHPKEFSKTPATQILNFEKYFKVGMLIVYLAKELIVSKSKQSNIFRKLFDVLITINQTTKLRLITNKDFCRFLIYHLDAFLTIFFAALRNLQYSKFTKNSWPPAFFQTEIKSPDVFASSRGQNFVIKVASKMKREMKPRE